MKSFTSRFIRNTSHIPPILPRTTVKIGQDRNKVEVQFEYDYMRQCTNILWVCVYALRPLAVEEGRKPGEVNACRTRDLELCAQRRFKVQIRGAAGVERHQFTNILFFTTARLLCPTADQYPWITTCNDEDDEITHEDNFLNSPSFSPRLGIVPTHQRLGCNGTNMLVGIGR